MLVNYNMKPKACTASSRRINSESCQNSFLLVLTITPPPPPADLGYLQRDHIFYAYLGHLDKLPFLANNAPKEDGSNGNVT